MILSGLHKIVDSQGFEVAPVPENGAIVSVVPSQTELLFDLHQDQRVKGVTKFCIHPANRMSEKQKVGGTKNLNLEKIAALNPDLILANKEENTQEEILWLQQRFPVYVSDVKNVDDALKMIDDVAFLTQAEIYGTQLVNEIQENRKLFGSGLEEFGSVVYLIWNNPFMTVGGDTFISAMIQEGGWDNCFADAARYPEILLDDIIAEQPNFLFLSSEPFPFKREHAIWFREKLPHTEVLIVDGEMFSWYGSRMKLSFAYFETLRRKSF